MRDLAAIQTATRLVVRGDLIFTTPAGVVQIVSGTLLIIEAGWTLDTPWLWVALVLFGFAGLCWLPVMWIQIRMRRLAQDATHLSQLPVAYWRLFNQWVVLGALAFPALIVVFWLMIAKPSL
ncbi:putative membrane protein [Rubricella aquisinus]|uniref:Putative membrane protein n=1 Tax=Rubricella aquisinus TaxID=2028108 RepID=A0A840X5E7_9RHOB|nr:putative membrane protein [Rubricella aquisinus]